MAPRPGRRCWCSTKDRGRPSRASPLSPKWKVIAKTFHGLGSKDVDAGGDFPIKWVVWGAIASSIVLAAVQKISLGFPLWLSFVSVFLSLILMLIGIRVLGETNWAPI